MARRSESAVHSLCASSFGSEADDYTAIPLDAKGLVFNGKYEIEERLGSGHFGDVYSCESRSTMTVFTRH